MTKKEITKYFFMLGTIISSIYFWLIVFKFTNTTTTESWFLPLAVFGSMFVFWAVAIFLESEKWKLFLFGAVLVLTGGIFVQNIFFVGSAILAIGILYLGTIWVHESMEARIKLNIWMSLRLGRRLFVVAITLIIIGGFLMPVVLSGEKRSLPLITITEKQAKMAGKVMSIFDANLDNEGLAKMTVDEYILKEQEGFEKKKRGVLNRKMKGNVFVGQKREDIIIGGRAGISKLVSRNVSGDEKIINIFAEMINNKINDYFNTEASQASKFAPLFFAILSFFAVFSIGSFATSFLTFLVAGIFRILIWTKLIEIGTKKIEVEIIN